MVWPIVKFNDSLELIAQADGVWLRDYTGAFDLSLLHSVTLRNRLGRLLPTVVPQLLELELATLEKGGVRIPHSNFASLEARYGIDAFDGILPWAAFSIEIETSGWPGGDAFSYFYRFYSGSKAVNVDRLGCLVRRGNDIFRLDSQTFALIEAIDTFNSLAPENKAKREAFLRFAEIKELAEGVGAQLDAFLGKERVIVPSHVGLDLIAEADGRISFVPKIDGAPEDAMRQAFWTSDDVEEVYSVADSGGGRVRVVLDEAQREVLRRMQRVRHLVGLEKVEVLRDPYRVFDGVAGVVQIGSEFGRRVKGIGDFPFVAQPYLQRSSTGIFEDAESARGEIGRFSAGLKCHYTDGTVTDLPFTSREQLFEFQATAREARRAGRGTVELSGKSIVVDDSFLKALDELVSRVSPPKASAVEKSKDPRRYLLIYTNENELEYEEPEEIANDGPRDSLPKSIQNGVLKDHQLTGVSWLQRVFLRERRGCLLADDMGLGKTLQVLTFLAWLIEGGRLEIKDGQSEEARWAPILIVTPVTLLENQTWLEDMRRWFADGGNVFQPWVALHGSRLREFRRQGIDGRETAIGEAVLDLDRLKQHRVVLTNYETVVNYQHSFARIQWSVVVTDEAQEYKTASTKVSHALKSLCPRFRVACTGTPVETTLMDVWNIFDFLQPGKLLGSASEFRERYGNPIRSENQVIRSAALSDLKERLQLNRRNAFVLRREKTQLLGLPPKIEHVIECDLSQKQREWHLDLVGRVRAGGEGNHPLSIIQQLMRVYQHPALVPRYEPIDSGDAISQCAKLAEVLRCLWRIKERGEKALIFTRSLDMQQILAMVCESEFGVKVDIVNGATSRHGDTGSQRQTRRSIVSRFRATPGFNVIVLSPDVAGVGLTLTEANHVIHYGRWWNPAKESQATDRVYRIGQSKTVHVYYPIAKDPQGRFETFDEKLDALIRRRRALASEFLTPMPSETDLENELLKSVLETETVADEVPALTKDDVRRLPWHHFEALLAVLEEKRGNKVVLTQRAGDDKADVLAVGQKQIRLIQCKHSMWGARVDANVVAEAIGAMEIYRAKFLREYARTYTITPIVVTNGSFTPRAKSEAKHRDVELLGDAELWKLLEATPCTPAEVQIMEGRRLASMRDVQAALRNLL